jgi:hypothetical protein
MKLPSILLVAGLSLAPPFAARAEISAQARLETFYLDPQPAAVPALIKELSRQGYFEKPGHVAVAIGFLGTVFAQNSDKVDQWLLELGRLPLSHHRLIASALWQAGNPLGREMMRAMGLGSSVPEQIAELADVPSLPVADTPVLSASSMNLQWGAFLATGDSRYIKNVLAAIGTGQGALDQTVCYALAADAAAHPLVLEICRTELRKQPTEVQSVLSAAIDDATAKAKSPRS